MPSSTAAGGAAPAVIMLDGVRERLVTPGWLRMVFMTIGAPQRWVTPWRSIASRIAAASTRRKHTLVPAMAATVQGKHQPLQWNIGSVQR